MYKFVLSGVLLVMSVMSSIAQCAMCKATLETKTSESNVGSGINKGVLFLMPIPYLIMGTIAVVFYYRNKKKKAAQAQ